MKCLEKSTLTFWQISREFRRGIVSGAHPLTVDSALVTLSGEVLGRVDNTKALFSSASKLEINIIHGRTEDGPESVSFN